MTLVYLCPGNRNLDPLLTVKSGKEKNKSMCEDVGRLSHESRSSNPFLFPTERKESNEEIEYDDNQTLFVSAERYRELWGEGVN